MTAVALVLALALAVLHVVGGRLRFRDIPRSRWLSAAGGIAVAYVFVQLLPELARLSGHVDEVVAVDRPVYVLALVGLALFYGIERRAKQAAADAATGPRSLETWWSFGSYALYNAVIGYVLVREHETLTAVLLFALAMGVHFLVNDRSLRAHHRQAYDRAGRWVVAAAIVAGAAVGAVTEVHRAVIGALVGFVAGGVVMNVMKEELPEERRSSFPAFAAGAVGYTLLLLAI